MKWFIAVCAIVFSTGLARADDQATLAAAAKLLNAKALHFTLPDQLKWRDPEGSPANQAVLLGDPTKPGLYIYINKFQPGNFSKPHFHPNDRYITVIKGPWWVGTGTDYDPWHRTVAMPTGSFVVHTGRQVHYDGAKNNEVILLIMGEGPATRTQVPYTDHSAKD